MSASAVGLGTCSQSSSTAALGRLHPAVVRPGRCLSTIEVRSFTRSEAAAWLGPEHGARDEMTLAEMYAMQSGEAIAVTDSAPRLGYL